MGAPAGQPQAGTGPVGATGLVVPLCLAAVTSALFPATALILPHSLSTQAAAFFMAMVFVICWVSFVPFPRLRGAFADVL